MAMIAMTTNSSISVNADRRRGRRETGTMTDLRRVRMSGCMKTARADHNSERGREAGMKLPRLKRSVNHKVFGVHTRPEGEPIPVGEAFCSRFARLWAPYVGRSVFDITPFSRVACAN